MSWAAVFWSGLTALGVAMREFAIHTHDMNIGFFKDISNRSYIIASCGIIFFAFLSLFFMGRVPICECGYIKLWHGVTMSSENSQHISDWYSFSHIIHGFGFYLLFRFIAPRWPVGARFLAALLLESSWEVFENTDFIINRYREATISFDYYGDSVLNSISDILFMVLGFFAAYHFPVWSIVAATIFFETFVLYFIRDNLALNIIMLLYPFEFIKQWQGG